MVLPYLILHPFCSKIVLFLFFLLVECIVMLASIRSWLASRTWNWRPNEHFPWWDWKCLSCLRIQKYKNVSRIWCYDMSLRQKKLTKKLCVSNYVLYKLRYQLSSHNLWRRSKVYLVVWSIIFTISLLQPYISTSYVLYPITLFCKGHIQWTNYQKVYHVIQIIL